MYKRILHYVHALDIRFFLLSELRRLKRSGKRIPNHLESAVWAQPANAEDWVNLLCFLDPDEKILLIDVGANNGDWFSAFLRVFPNSEIDAFEPTSKPFHKLYKKFSTSDNIRLYNEAISNEEGPRSIHIGDDDTLSSFEAYNEIANKDRRHTPNEVEEIACRRLDSFKFNTEGRKVCLKVDVQGHEVQVFEGAGSVLDVVDVCICELSFTHEYKGLPPSFSHVVEICSGHGLHPIIFQEYGRHLSNYAYERDVIFAKEYLLSEIFSKT